jgi:hypothetical protein
MPFADAKYPPKNIERRQWIRDDDDDWADTSLTLPNGTTLHLRTQPDSDWAVSLAIGVADKGDRLTTWVCEITENGVLAFGSSGDACNAICERTKRGDA